MGRWERPETDEPAHRRAGEVTGTRKFAERREIMKQRAITLKADAPATDKREIAQIMAYYITGGDPAGYLDRLAEKQQRERELAAAK